MVFKRFLLRLVGWVGGGAEEEERDKGSNSLHDKGEDNRMG